MVRLHSQNVAKNAAFVCCELGLKLPRVHHRRSLFRWVFTQIAHRFLHQSLPVFGQDAEFLQRCAHLLPHLWGQALHGLDVIHQTLALLGRHAVNLSQALE